MGWTDPSRLVLPRSELFNLIRRHAFPYLKGTQISRQSVIQNGFLAALQVAVSSAALFLLYRFLLEEVGTELIGVWAVVTAAASLSRLSELGIASSAIKFVARYIALNEPGKASEVIETTVLTVGTVLGVTLLILWPVFDLVAAYAIPSAQIDAAKALIPYALLSLWTAALANIAVSGLDGCQRIDLRVMTIVLGTISLLSIAWWSVPTQGLVGLVLAQTAQSALVFTCAWHLLRKQLKMLPPIPFRWRSNRMMELLNYGMTFQVVSIMNMLFDPVTKMLMSHIGGLTTTAYYDMAGRVVLQIRALLISGSQVIVPKMANLQESAPDRISKAYIDSYSLNYYISLPLYVGIVLAAPLVSELWIGQATPEFITYTLLLAAGYWINTLVGPAYFASLGIGALGALTASHLVIGLLNAVSGYTLGLLFGSVGVVLGYTLSLATGSLVLLVMFHRARQISWARVLPASYPGLSCLALLTIALGYAFRPWLTEVSSPTDAALGMLVLAYGPFLALVLRQPTMKDLWGALKRRTR